MVFDLKLQTAMEPIQIFWALNVHRPGELHLNPFVVFWNPIEHISRKVRQTYLNVNDPTNCVREEEERPFLTSRR